MPTRKELIGARTPDLVAQIMRSWVMVMFMVFFIASWIVLNSTDYVDVRHWDPFPFDMLKIILVIQTAFTGPFLLMHQHKQSESDRVIRRAVYEIDLDMQTRIKNIEDKIRKI